MHFLLMASRKERSGMGVLIGQTRPYILCLELGMECRGTQNSTCVPKRREGHWGGEAWILEVRDVHCNQQCQQLLSCTPVHTRCMGHCGHSGHGGTRWGTTSFRTAALPSLPGSPWRTAPQDLYCLLRSQWPEPKSRVGAPKQIYC